MSERTRVSHASSGSLSPAALRYVSAHGNVAGITHVGLGTPDHFRQVTDGQREMLVQFARRVHEFKFVRRKATSYSHLKIAADCVGVSSTIACICKFGFTHAAGWLWAAIGLAIAGGIVHIVGRNRAAENLANFNKGLINFLELSVKAGGKNQVNSGLVKRLHQNPNTDALADLAEVVVNALNTLQLTSPQVRQAMASSAGAASEINERLRLAIAVLAKELAWDIEAHPIASLEETMPNVRESDKVKRVASDLADATADWQRRSIDVA